MILGGVGLGVGMWLGIVLLLSMSSFFLPPFFLPSSRPPSFFPRLLPTCFLYDLGRELIPHSRGEEADTRLPPVLCDPLVAKAHYDKIEKEVEEGVRQSQIREKAMGKRKPAQATAGKE